MKENFSAKPSPSNLDKAVARSKRNLLLALVGSAIICSLLTVFAPINNDRIFYSNVLAIITSGAAFVLSAQIVLRQKTKGVLPRLYAALGLAVALWFVAETIWAYYELVAAIETPFPSVADAFWLAGYAPFFYFLYGILKHVLSEAKSLFEPILLSSSVGLIFISRTVYSLYQAADLTTQEGIITYLVSAAYPIADMFLIVPAVSAFFLLRKGKLTSTPFAYFIVATNIFIVADIGYVYFIELKMNDVIWIWNPLYNVGYLAIAGALFWHKSFFTIEKKKIMKSWQEKNR